MTTTTMNDRMIRPNRALRDLTLSLATSAGLATTVLATGIITHARPYAIPLACWCLVAAGIVGTHVAARNVPWGWLLLVSLQPMWIAYAISTEQYGFVVGAVACGLGQLSGFLRSRRESSDKEGRR
jgi:hypothetical protein